MTLLGAPPVAVGAALSHCFLLLLSCLIFVVDVSVVGTAAAAPVRS